MRAFHLGSDHFAPLDALPDALPTDGFIWLSYERRDFEAALPALQARLHAWGCSTLLDFHVRDLLNAQLPSHFEDTSGYDVLVFRRLATGDAARAQADAHASDPLDSARALLTTIDTSPVGFALFDRVLVSVHPPDCAVREFFAQRLAQLAEGAAARGVVRLPAAPAELMLRMVNHMVDSYLDLRRLLTRQMSAVQTLLLNPRSRFSDWPALLALREALHLLEDTCEDQRSAMQEWIDALLDWPEAREAASAAEHELLLVRSRDVQEHIERVLAHVRRTEHSIDAGVQMHFSLLGQRTNDVMRTLTVLTAIFLPLNLITGFFGMNFDVLPLTHSARGVWITLGAMAVLALGLVFYFRRKRYLEESTPG